MKKNKSRKIWTIIVVVIFSSLFFLQANPVIAMFSNEHVVEVLYRMWFNVLPNYNSGRYYQALMMKHLDEFNQILDDHPEHFNEFTNVIISFLPVMEAQPDNTSEGTRITEKQIDDLKYELDWISFLASPTLREDLERERKRFPLENFIGMTMYEVLGYLDSNWGLAPIAESVLPSPTPYPTPICRIGDVSDCSKAPSLVPDSAGLWAFEVVDNVYFEYPADWEVKEDPNNTEPMLTFIPALDSFENAKVKAIYLAIGKFTRPSDIEYSPLTFPQDVLDRPAPIWKQRITLPDFDGSEFLWKQAKEQITFLEAILYNKDQQLMISLMLVVDNDQVDQLVNDPTVAEKKLPKFHHILENIRIWNE